jgi:hypothetical protein
MAFHLGLPLTFREPMSTGTFMHVNNCLFRGNTRTFGNRRISSLWHIMPSEDLLLGRSLKVCTHIEIKKTSHLDL